MPAPRLPWVKLWIESAEHEKVALLPDPEYRTWTLCLLRGSQQPTRWRFASAQHAAIVTGRPVEHIRTLIAVRLLDEREQAVWVHDFGQWQEKHPSDFAPRKHADAPANAPSISSGTLREDSAKTPHSNGTTPHTIGVVAVAASGQAVEGAAVRVATPPYQIGERSANAPRTLRGERDRERESLSVPNGTDAPVADAPDASQTPAPSSVRAAPKPDRVAEFIDAVRAGGLTEYIPTPADTKVLAKGNPRITPREAAEIYCAIAQRRFGDEHMREHLSAATAMNAVNAWRTRHRQPPRPAWKPEPTLERRPPPPQVIEQAIKAGVLSPTSAAARTLAPPPREVA